MHRLIQHWVTRQAGIRPDATAVAWKNQFLTYRELDERSNQVANYLRSRGASRGDRICFCLPKSPAAITAMLGILKADCVYVPVDVDCPATRIRRVLTACQPFAILTDNDRVPLVREAMVDAHVPNTLVGTLANPLPEGCPDKWDFTSVDVMKASTDVAFSENTSDDAAHILFTSGSTGEPKGVVITHDNVIRYVDWVVQYFGMDEDDRVSGHAPLHFDLSTQDIYAAFAAGCELHPVPPELNLLPHKLAGFIRERRLTQWFSVPSILNYLSRFRVVNPGDFPHLKRLMWCGEVLPTPTLQDFMQKLPQVQFTNLYGPTEATIASSFYTVPHCPASESQQIPIGTACDGEELLVLDEQLMPTIPGEIGHLFIAGCGLSPGYWRDEDRTDAVFMRDPGSLIPRRIYKTGDLAKIGEDGLVYYLGRVDSQIKSRGYRIELGEIETALNTMAILRESAVVAIDTGGFENKSICCAYVPHSETGVTVASIKAQLATLIPRYMIPQIWLATDRLPRNANGKTDKPRLREQFSAQQKPDSNRPAAAAAQTSSGVSKS